MRRISRQDQFVLSFAPSSSHDQDVTGRTHARTRTETAMGKQVLSSEGATFLRLANDRGWTYARSPTEGSVLFEDLAGGVSKDT